MKYPFFILLIFTITNASEGKNQGITIHPTSIYMIMFFLLLALIITYAFFYNKCEKMQKISTEDNEKIKLLEEQQRDDEKDALLKKQEVEKEMIMLHHTITDLERQLKEGTKNQVVAKIEELAQKRQNTSTV